MDFDYLVFIGRFQPLHRGHLYVIRRGLERAARLIVLLGSAQESRTAKNYWTVAERAALFRVALTPAEWARLTLRPLLDKPGDDEAWVAQVRGLVGAIAPAGARIGLIGHDKDASSYYLRLLPDWPLLAVDNYQHISATPLRTRWLAGEREIAEIPPEVLKQLESFARGSAAD